ncbi:MAG TPA: hypothetical protein PK264_22305, partial [Hyphomicrobiaceae bacterium]|nr:hypothetical protein [Hyphomicrobiaceae bacterium]
RPGEQPVAIAPQPVPTTSPPPAVTPVPPPKAPGPVAQSGSCADACRAQHEQCRIASKGDPRCGQMLTACLQRCISSKGR